MNTTTLSTEELLKRLKSKIEEKLNMLPYETEDGKIIDPLPARDMAAIGTFLLKLREAETKESSMTDGLTVVPIPALPSL